MSWAKCCFRGFDPAGCVGMFIRWIENCLLCLCEEIKFSCARVSVIMRTMRFNRKCECEIAELPLKQEKARDASYLDENLASCFSTVSCCN